MKPAVTVEVSIGMKSFLRDTRLGRDIVPIPSLKGLTTGNLYAAVASSASPGPALGREREGEAGREGEGEEKNHSYC